jgi:hypothetical protein
MRELIKRLLKEESKKDLSRLITRLLETSILPKYKDVMCGVKVTSPKDRESIQPGKEFLQYKINVYFIGGRGTKYFHETMAIRRMYEKIMDEIWNVVESYTGESTDMYATYYKECEDSVKGEQTEGELTERCWKGYTQKGMKTMFGKKYPNCVKKK